MSTPEWPRTPYDWDIKIAKPIEATPVEPRPEAPIDRFSKIAGPVLRRVFIPSEETLKIYKEAGVTYSIFGGFKL